MRNFFYTTAKILSLLYMAMTILLGLELISSEVPDNIYVREGEEARIDVDFPLVIKSAKTATGDYETKQCSMFGWIPVKEISVNVVQGQQLYASGDIVGIYTQCEGIFVVDTCEIENQSGEMVSPSAGVVQTGDYIVSMNGQTLQDKEDLAEIVRESKGEAIFVKLIRGGKERQVSLTPALAKNGSYMLGMWVKDDLAGVGTVTYVSPTGDFATLGHGMSNGENNDLLCVDGGDLYISRIIGIEKGKKGTPGEIKGIISYGKRNHLGDIAKNTPSGVFGELDTEDLNDYLKEESLYDVGYKQEIKTGPAQIISEISGKREVYDIRITYVDYLAQSSNKGLHIQVTDPDLLELTGGIVQGMSGSPIIQNGKIVGAVTHVLINDPTKGYGIFIEEMLDH